MRGARPELRVVENGSDGEQFKSSDADFLNDCGNSSCQLGNLKNGRPQPMTILPPPSLPPDIATEWERVAADLRERRLWKDSMAGMVTSYVLAQATLLRLEISIAAEGDWVTGASGARKPHPSTGLLRSSRETVARLGAELGLSPTARSRKALQARGQGNLFQDNEFDL
jgi:P27 family predicted phage terminase small subunit